MERSTEACSSPRLQHGDTLFQWSWLQINFYFSIRIYKIITLCSICIIYKTLYGKWFRSLFCPYEYIHYILPTLSKILTNLIDSSHLIFIGIIILHKWFISHHAVYSYTILPTLCFNIFYLEQLNTSCFRTNLYYLFSLQTKSHWWILHTCASTLLVLHDKHIYLHNAKAFTHLFTY